VNPRRPEGPVLPGLSAAWIATAFTLALAGCGGSHSGPAGNRTALPQVHDQGGAIVVAPEIVTVTFAGDAMTADLQSFGRTLASSSWWNTVRAGYCGGAGDRCVGDGPPGTSVVVMDAPAASYTDSASGGPSSLQDWLSGAIAAGTLPKPDANSVTNTIYALYFPATTAVSFDGQQSCVNLGFNGYHNSMAAGSQQVVYAVIDECDPLPPQFPSAKPITVLQNTTLTASHEIIEAATDPVESTDSTGKTSYGYYLDITDPDTWGWIDVAGGEIADLCVDQFGLGQDETADGAFTVQRIWSNVQASGSGDPCNPVIAGHAYFNAAPRRQVVVVDVGARATFEVDAFSDAGAAAWTLSAQDWSPSSNQYLSFSIAGARQTTRGPEIMVNDGSTVEVTVTLLRDPGALVTGEADGAIVSLSGDPTNPTAGHYWPFIVMSPADATDAGISASTTARHRHPGHFRRVSPRRLPPSVAYWKGWAGMPAWK
jgi:hypothetical protein